MAVIYNERPCLQRFRASKKLCIGIVFIAMMLDLMLVTTIEPILPDMLYATEHHESQKVSLRPLQHRGHNDTTEYISRTGEIGTIIAAKPGTEMVANIFAGFIIDRFGHKWTMILGCFGNLAATIGFAFSPSFICLLISRMIQAIGSSLSVVSGLAMLACMFHDDRERAKANGIAFGGLSIGVVLGFPFGSTFYQFLGRQAPFFILACLMLLDGVLRLFVDVPSETAKHQKSSCGQFLKLLGDPYILIGIGCNFILHIGLGMMCTTAPAWILGRLHVEQWNLGVILVVSSSMQLIAQVLTGIYAIGMGRWIFCMSGLLLFGGGLILYPMCPSKWWVLGPEIVSRIGLGMVVGVLSELLAHLVDIRHNSNYGAIYGLYCASYNMGFVAGPIVGGYLIKIVGFKWLYYGTAALIIAYSFTCLLYKNMNGSIHTCLVKSEVVASIQDGSVGYGTIPTTVV